MLENLLKSLPSNKAQAGAVIIRLRPPDLVAMDTKHHESEEPDGDEEVVEKASCPICEDEHEPLDLPPDAAMILAHLVKSIHDAGDDENTDDADDNEGDVEDDDEDGEAEEELAHDHGLHLMPRR